MFDALEIFEIVDILDRKCPHSFFLFFPRISNFSVQFKNPQFHNHLRETIDVVCQIGEIVSLGDRYIVKRFVDGS